MRYSACGLVEKSPYPRGCNFRPMEKLIEKPLKIKDLQQLSNNLYHSSEATPSMAKATLPQVHRLYCCC